MHVKSVTFFPENYPTKDRYPFHLPIFQHTRNVVFCSPVTFFIGENGTGKSTLLEALAHRCGIHIWQDIERTRFEINPYEEELFKYITLEWADGPVPGSYFASAIFRHFAQSLDEWAKADPKVLDYFGGRSLMAQSHGQSLLSFFKARYRIRGLYLLDEPETALSPRSQLELVRLLHDMGRTGRAQFVIATHSPILLACRESKICSFDHMPIQEIEYEKTEYYQIYRSFMEDRRKYLDQG